jgi:hypothetical protein
MSKLNSNLEGQVKGIYKSGIEMMYFMRGALSKDEMLSLTPLEKEIISEFIKERIETELSKKHTPPIY